MLRYFIDALYSPQKLYNIAFLGLHDGGKTTLLYHLKHGRPVEHTIPTVGFEVEEVDIPAISGINCLRARCWEYGRPYHEMTTRALVDLAGVDTWDAVVWFVHCTAADWMVEDSLHVFRDVVLADPADGPFVDVPVLILLTKQDTLEISQPAKAIHHKFSKLLAGRTAPWTIQSVSLIEGFASPMSGVVPAFHWLKTAFEVRGG